MLNLTIIARDDTRFPLTIADNLYSPKPHVLQHSSMLVNGLGASDDKVHAPPHNNAMR